MQMAAVVRMSQPDDINPRPHKRSRVLDNNSVFSTPSTLTAISAPSSGSEGSSDSIRNIPPSVLLSSIPGLVAQPPNHRYYVLSLQVSLNALRKCLACPALSPEIECRAWTGLAEVGMRAIASGFCESEEHDWARGLEMEVDKALSKGAIIAQKHPSLRSYKYHIALLQAQYSHWQHKTKYARTQLRNLISSLQPTDPPYLLYSAQLASISLSTSPHPTSSNKEHIGPSSCLSPKPSSPQDIHAALSTIEAMETHALKHKHPQIALLSYILRLRVLVSANMWSEVPEAIQLVESALGLSYEPIFTPKARKPTSPGTQHEGEATFIMFENPFEAALTIHLLMMSVAYFTHIGSASEASPRLTHLHALLDSGVLDLFPDGLIQAQLPSGPSLIIQVTHPRILFLLAFLVSSTAKRDVVGRKPKRKVFAGEGLAASDKKNVPPPLTLSLWASTGDVDEIEERLARIKADLMCEMISVSIMRSEFTEAENTLAELIAHTRTYSIFSHFAARISLHHAHLAHSLGNAPRATTCYIAASQLSQEGDFVYLAARIGLVCLNLVKYAQQVMECGDRKGKRKAIQVEDEMVDLKELLKECRAWGGTLDAVAHVLEACFSSEILKAKQHLKAALTLASNSQDNHLRASILALIASQYFYTARDHCISTLQTCEQLAAGLGAPLHKEEIHKGVPGNVHLALWVGKHFLDLHRQAGREVEAQQRASNNARLEQALESLRDRGQTFKPEE